VSLRALARPARTSLAAVVQLVLCAVAIACAAPLMQIGWGYEYLSLPEWQAVLAQVGVVALLLVAVWQLVLAVHERVVRKVLLGLAGLAGALLALLAILYTVTGYWAVLLAIGIVWLVIARRTWPRDDLRGPRLRAESLEPPPRGRVR